MCQYLWDSLMKEFINIWSMIRVLLQYICNLGRQRQIINNNYYYTLWTFCRRLIDAVEYTLNFVQVNVIHSINKTIMQLKLRDSRSSNKTAQEEILIGKISFQNTIQTNVFFSNIVSCTGVSSFIQPSPTQCKIRRKI